MVLASGHHDALSIDITPCAWGTAPVDIKPEQINATFASLVVSDATYAKVFRQKPLIERKGPVPTELEVAVVRSVAPIIVRELGDLERNRTKWAKLVRTLKQIIGGTTDKDPTALAPTTWVSFCRADREARTASVWRWSERPLQSNESFEFSGDLQSYETEILNYRSAGSLERTLVFCKRQLLHASTRISAIKKWLFSAVSIFCCLRWECRRWFVHHGARPPKSLAQVTTSLFAGACSSLVLAQ